MSPPWQHQDDNDDDDDDDNDDDIKTVPGIPDLCEQIIVVRLQRAPDLHGRQSCQVSASNPPNTRCLGMVVY